MANDQKKMVDSITSMDEDFAKWYTDVCKKAELVSYTSVKGCMVIRPYGYAIWENIQRILVIATEGMSRLVDWSDRNTCVLFGDGSGAAVVERSDSDCMLSFVEHVQGNWEVLNIDYGKTGRPCVHMNGGEVFKFAVNSACRDILEAMKAAEITDKEMINHVILHQANKRITNAVVSKLGIPEERYISTIHKYGNTSSSGCAIALDELNRSGRLQKGDKIAFAAFGGGLTSAAAIIRWNK